MNIFREALLNRRLKKALARHGCRMASGVETLRDGTQVTLEPNVKLGKAKIHSPAVARSDPARSDSGAPAPASPPPPRRAARRD